jgi:tetratricopeptide (TPR) repeat protein
MLKQGRNIRAWGVGGALLLAAAFMAVEVAAQAPAPERPAWWNGAWRYRRLLTPGPAGAAQWFWLEAAGRARADGTDIAVVTPSGKPVPHNVFCSTADGRHLVVVREPKPEKGSYGVYYGNPQAPAAAPAPVDAGLFLKTYPIPKDADVESWAAAEKTLRRAGAPFGGAAWSQVFEAANPFGPAGDYISVYEGVLLCPKEGAYGFATMSDDASFLFIDGALVAEWPGRRHAVDAGRRGEKGGTKQLKGGPHAFKYVGFSFEGVKRCAASWKPPDRPNWEIIPPAAFGSAALMKAVATEEFMKPVCADFHAERVAYLEIDHPQRGVTAAIVAVQFTALASARGGQPAEVKWDFGDGQSALAPAPLHLYFSPGKYRVSLTASAGGVTDSFTLSYDARMIWNDLEFTEAKRRRFLDWSAACRPESLSTTHLLAFRDFLKEMTAPPRLFEVNCELDKRRKDLPAPLAAAVAQEVAEYNTEPLRKYDVAEKYYAALIDGCGKDEAGRKLDLRLKLGDLYFYYVKDFDRAMKTYAQVRDEAPRDDARRHRLAVIRMGDVERDRKKFEEARRLYLLAESDPAVVPKEPRPVAEGRFRQETEFQLAQGNGEAALNSVEQWLWVYPTRRLEGEPMVFRLKANLLMKNYSEVMKQAELFINAAEDPEALPTAHLLAGQAAAEAGDKERARAHYRAVLEKWPESAAVKGARAGLDKLK